MWIQVRTIDGSQTRTIEDVSRKATIEELRERVWALFDVRPECQRLFYRGKQVRSPARSPGASSRRPGTRLGVQGCARDGPLAGRVMRGRGLRLWGPHLQARLAGRKAGVQGAVCSWAGATGTASEGSGGSLPAFGVRESEPGRATGSGSHVVAREGRAAQSLPIRTCLLPALGLLPTSDVESEAPYPVPSLEGIEH